MRIAKNAWHKVPQYPFRFCRAYRLKSSHHYKLYNKKKYEKAQNDKYLIAHLKSPLAAKELTKPASLLLRLLLIRSGLLGNKLLLDCPRVKGLCRCRRLLGSSQSLR